MKKSFYPVLALSLALTGCIHYPKHEISQREHFTDFYFTEGLSDSFSLELEENPYYILFQSPKPFSIRCTDNFTQKEIACTPREEKKAKRFLSGFIRKWQDGNVCRGDDFLSCFYRKVNVRKV